jgi:predicted RNase H-like HicB family nuclease
MENTIPFNLPHPSRMVLERAHSPEYSRAPDLPGCVATGATREEVEERMREAIRMHLDGMMEDGLEIPEPSSFAEYIDA